MTRSIARFLSDSEASCFGHDREGWDTPYLAPLVKTTSSADAVRQFGLIRPEERSEATKRFLSRDAMHSAAYAVVQFCPSVRPSRSCIVSQRVNKSSNFFRTKYCSEIPTGYEKSRFSTNISLYLGNDTLYGYSYRTTPKGTRMRAIEWCHF